MQPDAHAYLSVPTAMSGNRSSSQVRNLLAMFENNNNTTPANPDSTSPDRGRSNGHLSPASNGDRPLSKVRSSFVSVEHGVPSSPSPAMDIDPQKTKDEYRSRQESSASLRRHSFSLDEGSDAVANLRQSMSQESERRGSNPMVAETIPEAAIEQTPTASTPAVEAKDYMAAGQIAHANGDMPQSKLRDEVSPNDVAGPTDTTQTTDSATSDSKTLPADEMPADNPDKPVRSQTWSPFFQMLSPYYRCLVRSKSRALCSPLISRIALSSHLPPTPVQIRSRRRLQSFPRVLVVAPSLPPMQPLLLHLTDLPTSSQKHPNHQPTLLPKRRPLSRKRLRPLPSRSPQQPSHHLLSRPGLRFESLAVLPLPRLSRRPTLLLSRREAQHLECVTTQSANASFRKSPQSKPTRPRSPTRPIKISSHLTAPTAASAAKQDAQPPKTSVSVSKPAVVNRPQARAPAPAAKPTARSSLASTTNVPKKAESKPAAASKGSDDSFLARMMRPTASSASKVHDKTDVKTKVEKSKEEQAAGASTPQAASGDQEHGNAGLEATPAFDAATIR
jgi:hypothetical protein